MPSEGSGARKETFGDDSGDRLKWVQLRDKEKITKSGESREPARANERRGNRHEIFASDVLQSV